MLYIQVKGDFARAEELYKKGVQLDPSHTGNLGNYGMFLKKVKRDYITAEKMFALALKTDPHHAAHLGKFSQHPSPNPNPNPKPD